MAENKMQVTSFQDGDDYVVVFHNCKPDLKRIIGSLLDPLVSEEAAPSRAKPVPTAEKAMPVDREKEARNAMDDAMAEQYAAQDAAMDAMEPSPEDMAAIIGGDPEPIVSDDMPVKTLGNEFGKYAGARATEESLTQILLTKKYDAYTCFMRGRSLCSDLPVRGAVGQAIVLYLREVFKGIDPVSVDEQTARDLLAKYWDAIPKRVKEAFGMSNMTPEDIKNSLPDDKLSKIFRQAVYRFAGNNVA